jgi:hypothetical protein
MSSEDAPRDLIGPFVLGACTPEESAQVRAHMTASQDFRAEVDSFDDVYGALLDVPTDDARPGNDLKRSIMAQVQAEASLFAAAGPDERAAIVREHAAAADAVAAQQPPAPDATPADGEAAAPRGEGAPAPSPRRTAFLEALMQPARATALAAVIVALIVGGLVLGSGVSEREVAVQPTPQAGNNASGRIVMTKSSSKLRLNGFPDAGTGKQYQVWLQTGSDDPKPTKVLFSVDAKGHGEATIPGDVGKADQVLLTAEPEGGSKRPTGEIMLHAQV